MLTVGVDGCKAGWLSVSLRAPGGCGASGDGTAGPDGASLSWAVHASLPALLASPDGRAAAMVVVDVPVGLTEGPPRPCDREARQVLGLRRSSVFTPPMRAMLGMESREAASRHGRGVRQGGGLSAQAWNIVPKIAEADRALAPAMQARVREGHPEVAFARLGGAPMAAAKRTPAGRAERLAVLARHGLRAEGALDAVRAVRPRPAAPDDVLDACALALTGRDALAGRAWVLGGQRDARGLIMEILG